MKHITNTKSIIAVLLALLTAFALFGAAVALAEGEEDESSEAGETSQEDTSSEETVSGDESSESTPSGDESSEDESSGDESSGDESSEDPVDPDAYTVVFNISGGGVDSAVCKVNGEEISGRYVGKAEDGRITVSVKASAKYDLVSVIKSNEPQDVNGEGECSFGITPIKGNTYNVDITVSRKPEPVLLTVNAFGADSVTVKYGENEETYTEAISIMAGTQVTVIFDIGDTEFEKEKASFSANGVALALESASYTFTIDANTDLIFSYDMVLVSFKIHGPATVNVTGYGSFKNTGVGDFTHNIEYRAGGDMTFTVTPSLNYKLDYVASGGKELKATGGSYSIPVEGAAAVEISVSSAGTTPQPKDEFNVRVTVGTGGKMTVGTQTIAGGNGTLIKAAEGDELKITAIPDEGYVIDYFSVGGETKTLADNKYTLKVAADVNVTVKFKQENDTPVTDGISVKDIDWESDRIVVDVTGQSAVLREVFEKIASTPKGQAVEFRGAAGTVIVPTGVPFEGSSSSADLQITRVTSGTTFTSVGNLLNAGKPDAIPFAIYTFDFGLGLPEGTTVFLKTGAQLSGENVQLRLFDSTNLELYPKENAEPSYKAASDGTVGPLPYGNEGMFVLVKEVGEAPEIALEHGEGGDIIASPYNNVKAIGDDYTFYVNAHEGYTISSLRVDGVEIGEAAGKLTFQYSFKVTSQTHSVVASFAAEKAEESGGGSSKVGPILAIILVALAGAAALFIVKWRQEKY